MLSLYPLKNAKEAGKYYMEQDNYYLSDKDPLEVSSWEGKGANALGLCGAVQAEDFLKLLEGKLPNGEELGIILNKEGQRQHRPGTDLTFSAPKSVSLIALVGKDERLLKAHEEAVKETIAHIEKLAAEARLTVNGETIYEKTGNLTVASFLHTTSRALEANLHTHAIIMNATQRLDGKWRALSSRRQNDKEHLYNGFREFIYDNQHYLGLFYNASLAKKTTTLGFDIEIKDKYGNFEIKGLSKAYIEESSTRRKEIKEHLQERGLKSAKSAEIANHETRQSKVGIDQDSLRAFWEDVALKHKVDFKEIIDASKYKETGTISSIAEQPLCENAHEAVSDALTHLSRFRAKISHADLVRLSFEFGSGLIEHADIEQSIEAMLKTKTLLGEKYQTYTSQALLQKEEAFSQFIKKENATSAKALPLNKSGVSADIFKDKHLIQVVDVKNFGAEKQLLKEMVKNADNNGLKVYVISQGKYQCDYLKNEVKRESSSFIQWFKNCFKDDIVHTVSSFKHKYHRTLEERLFKNDRDDLIVVHEAQKLGFEDIEQLVSLAKTAHSKLVLLNHQQSLDGYRDGSPMKLLKEAGVKTHEAKGNAYQLKAEIIQSPAPKAKAIEQFITSNSLKTQQEVLIATSKKEQDELNYELRQALKAQGALSTFEMPIKVLSTNRLSPSQKKHLRFYQEGDMLVFKAFTPQEKSYKVFSKEEGALGLVDDKGKFSEFVIKEVDKFEVFQTKTIALSQNDRLVVDKPFQLKHFRLDKGETLEVKAIGPDTLSLSIKNKTFEISHDELKNAAISYDYVKRLSELNKPYEKALLASKPFQLSKEFLNELSQFSKQIEYYCPNAEKASHCLDRAKTSWTIKQSIEEQKKWVERDLNQGIGIIYEDLNYLSQALAKGKSINPEEVAKQAIAYATAKCAELEAAFSHTALLTQAMMFSLGKCDYKALEAELHTKIKEGKLIHLGTHWTTAEAKKLEQAIIDNNISHQNTMAPIVNDAKILANINPNLTKGQKEAVVLALTNQDRFITIEGLAGVGKTTMACEIQRLANEKNIQVFGLTPTHKARQELAAQGINSNTIDSFLLEDLPYPKKTLFIVDEVSMVSNRQYRALQQKAEQLDGRMAFTGDISQLQSLEAGIPHELTITSKTQKSVKMHDIIRQNPNPLLKEAVIYASQTKLKESLEKIEQINPKEYIRRDQSLAHEHHSSIIEIQIKEGEEFPFAPIYKALVTDYLSRTKECRDTTLIVAPANEDRHQIELLVRQGLKEIGEVGKNDLQVNRYIPKNLAKADMLFAANYEVGDILCFDKTYAVAKRGEYFTVEAIDLEKNELTCSHEERIYKINPHDFAHKAKMSLYVEIQSPLAVGDRIRIKKTQKEANLLANTEYEVKDVNQACLTLYNPKGMIRLDMDKEANRHWDYAHTDTAYSIQGGTDNLVIGLMLVQRKEATNHKSFEIIISRAKSQASIYTEDYQALKHHLDDPKQQDRTNKKSALLMEDAYLKTKEKEEKLQKINAQNNLKEVESDLNQTKVIGAQTINTSQLKGLSSHKISAKDIEAGLCSNMETLCLTLLGEPNRKLSKKSEFRYGAKGSLSINLNKGLWKNFETDEAGNALGLIKSVLNLTDFKEAISYAKEFLGGHFITPKAVQTQTENKAKTEEMQDIKKKQKILGIVSGAIPIQNTLGEAYLKHTRGLSHFDKADLLFNEKQETYHGKKKTFVPAIVAIARDDKGEVHHIEVIKLNPNKPQKDEKSNPIKQSFGSKDGYYVELNKAHSKDKTYVTEGVETGLSILSVDKNSRVVAVLGKANFKNINLQKLGQTIVLCVDNDGKDTFKNNLVIESIDRLEKAGKRVTVIMPQKENTDLNDVLVKEGKEALQAVIKKEINAADFKKMHDEHLVQGINKSNYHAVDNTQKNISINTIEQQISPERIKDFVKQEVSNSNLQKVRILEREL